METIENLKGLGIKLKIITGDNRGYLLMMTIFVGIFTLLFPFLPLAKIFEFTFLSFPLISAILGIVSLYVVTAEIVKRAFYKRVNF